MNSEVSADDDAVGSIFRSFIHQDQNLQQTPCTSEPQPKQQRRLAVILLFTCVVLVFADQNLMSPNLSTIASYFGFDDTERDQKLGGDIALAFFLLGAPASFVIGALADHYNRIFLFTITIIGGEGACFLTYWISTYRQLYICRAVTGLSMGGILPLIYSLLGDMFAAGDRHTASSYVGIGMGIGISLGQGIAGFLGPIFGWRVPFLIVSVPAMICALILLYFVHDPQRGGMEEAVRNRSFGDDNIGPNDPHDDYSYAPPPLQERTSDESSIELSPLDHHENDVDDISSLNINHEKLEVAPSRFNLVKKECSSFASLLSTPTVLLSLFQGAPGCVPWGIVNTYLNDFLSVDRNMSVQYATFVVLLFGVGNFFGMLVGGYGGAYLYRKDPRYPALLAGCSAILACFPFWILLNDVNHKSSIWFVGSVSICTGLLSGITGPIIKATLQNVTLPVRRGQAFALFNTFDDMGRGLGPVFVAGLIVQLGGRSQAFNIGVLGWIVCGIMNLFVFFTAYKDERHVQITVAESLRRNREQTPTSIEDIH
jgi:MFS family permease